MTGFAYRNGDLCADGVSLAAIAAEIGTPLYVYSHARLQENFRAFHEPLAALSPLICYAIKACPNISVIRALGECGAGADITSLGELERALAAGIPPQKIIFSGAGKTRIEIAAALKADIYQINAESISELHVISDVARVLGVRAPLALRVNPDIKANTHRKITTGELGSKFGIDAAQLSEAMALTRSLPALDLKGFLIHIGSHLFDYENFREAYSRLADMVRQWRGQGYDISRLDLGGGVGIPYDGQTQAPFADYARVVHETVGGLGCALAFEPGRRLVGDAGALVSRVIYDKQGVSHRFLVLDAGMNDLIRPAMYEARHGIVPLQESSAEASLVTVVGPVCESSDTFGDNYLLPGVGENGLVAILQAGAYGAAMASTYNGRALIPEVMAQDGAFKIIRRRIAVSEQISWEA